MWDVLLNSSFAWGRTVRIERLLAESSVTRPSEHFRGQRGWKNRKAEQVVSFCTVAYNTIWLSGGSFEKESKFGTIAFWIPAKLYRLGRIGKYVKNACTSSISRDNRYQRCRHCPCLCSQRQATKDTGTISGLNVLRIINDVSIREFLANVTFLSSILEAELSMYRSSLLIWAFLRKGHH